ncbi:colicin import membrane protein [Chitinivorax tropicus]|uniref:Colicin import membrane protein n=1 Tax=Chitinivorax tropicus TaxID=714531 RepID=A0A840MIG2_9PROT|nr:cell envelope integrity protein TolA [Chitinivorax tropicus]MBB5017305.1 colicin import membrane protein [Chitinivorax tropicus]
MTRSEHEDKPGLSLVLSIGVHVIFFGLLLFGLQWQNERKEPVAVELWSAMPKPSPQRQEVVPPPKVQKRNEPEPEPDVPDQVAKPDIALKTPRKAPEKKPEPEKVEKKPEPKVVPKPEPKPQEKKPEPKPAPPDDKMKQELKKLQDALAKETAQNELAQKNAANAANAAKQKAVGDYVSQVQARIKRFVSVPPDMQGNPEAVFEITLLPSMEVLNVVKRKSSGNTAYDDSIERAILKSSPLPPLPEGMRFQDFRVLRLVFRPND